VRAMTKKELERNLPTPPRRRRRVNTVFAGVPCQGSRSSRKGRAPTRYSRASLARGDAPLARGARRYRIRGRPWPGELLLARGERANTVFPGVPGKGSFSSREESSPTPYSWASVARGAAPLTRDARQHRIPGRPSRGELLLSQGTRANTVFSGVSRKGSCSSHKGRAPTPYSQASLARGAAPLTRDARQHRILGRLSQGELADTVFLRVPCEGTCSSCLRSPAKRKRPAPEARVAGKIVRGVTRNRS
jgi:hypothetical protein